MGKIKNLISKCFGKVTTLNSVFNQDLLIFSVLMIILSTLIKSNSMLKKFYKKINSSVKEKTSNNEEFNLNQENEVQIDEISHNLENKSINKINNEDKKINKSSCKNNIKIVYKKKDDDEKNKVCEQIEHIENIEPYTNNKKILNKKYSDKNENFDFDIDVNSTICSTPIFNLRSYKNIDFHYNFLIHDFDPKKINNLIMCKDIHQWMSSSSLSNEDLSDGIMPIYFILQKNSSNDVLEYLKLFVQTDKNGIKIAFIQKGCDYLYIKKYIDELISKKLIKDLLQDKHFHNYNLSNHDDVLDFLNNLLSLVLISEDFIGDKINLDIKNYHDNKNTFEYFFNTINSEACVFNTTI